MSDQPDTVTAADLTVIGEEIAVAGTRYRYGKWDYAVQEVTSEQTAALLVGDLNAAHVQHGRKPDAGIVRRTLYASAWRPRN